MNKKKITQALEFESSMYLVGSAFSLALTILLLTFAVLKNNVLTTLLGLLSLLIAHLDWKRMIYLDKLVEEIGG